MDIQQTIKEMSEACSEANMERLGGKRKVVVSVGTFREWLDCVNAAEGERVRLTRAAEDASRKLEELKGAVVSYVVSERELDERNKSAMTAFRRKKEAFDKLKEASK